MVERTCIFGQDTHGPAILAGRTDGFYLQRLAEQRACQDLAGVNGRVLLMPVFAFPAAL